MPQLLVYRVTEESQEQEACMQGSLAQTMPSFRWAGGAGARAGDTCRCSLITCPKGLESMAAGGDGDDW